MTTYSRPFSCLCDGLTVSGDIQSTRNGGICDYSVDVRSLNMTFTMVLVSTMPVLYAVPQVHNLELMDGAPIRVVDIRNLRPSPRLAGPQAFEYGIQECVKWHKQLVVDRSLNHD